MSLSIATPETASAGLDFTQCYASDYAGARTRFRAVAAERGAALTSYTHPSATAPDGGPLVVDVAVLGNPEAPRRLLLVSGTHGLEGQAGSAAQIAYLLAEDAPPPADVALVFVHALNPFGFAHMTRTTENNVDLNRNFVDHAAPYPANPGYEDLFPYLVPQDWTFAELQRNRAAVTAFGDTHGRDVLFDTMARGQYTHADGTNYGGNQREWSNLTLERIVADHLAGADKVGLIDWHTGIGDYAAAFFLCFNAEGSDLQGEAVRWWGADRILGQTPHGLKRPDYRGLVFHGLQRFLGGVPLVGAVVEFGTRGFLMRRALQLDIWLKFRAEADSDRVRLLKADLADAFVPFSAHWREATVNHGLAITRQAVTGLASWGTASEAQAGAA